MNTRDWLLACLLNVRTRGNIHTKEHKTRSMKTHLGTQADPQPLGRTGCHTLQSYRGRRAVTADRFHFLPLSVDLMRLGLLLQPHPTRSSQSNKDTIQHCRRGTQFVRLLVDLTSQQQASVSQGRICTDNFTCCHTEIEVADQTFYLNPVTVY